MKATVSIDFEEAKELVNKLDLAERNLKRISHEYTGFYIKTLQDTRDYIHDVFSKMNKIVSI